jgi:hypothetical protein
MNAMRVKLMMGLSLGIGLMAMLTATVAPAGARTRTAARLALVSPANDAHVRVDGATFVVRLRASGSRFNARLNGRNVTARFGRPVRGMRTARFERGRDFKLGPGSFVASIGAPNTRGLKTVGFAFTAWRRDLRSLKLTRRPIEIAGHGERSALTVDAVSDGRVIGKRIWVNGRLVRDHLTGPGDASHPTDHGCGCHIDLGANHGLHFGSNRVTFELEHPGWVFQQTTGTFRIARRTPLAGAGNDRVVARGQTAVLTGASSRPTHRGMKLRYRWRVVAKPKGAKVRLLNAGSERPRLVAKTAGHYRVRLVVIQGRAGVRAGDDTGRSAAPGAGAAGGDSTDTDDVDVSVAPTGNPMGVPIQTIAQGGGIAIGAAVYGSNGQWLHVLVLDQTTLTEISNTGYSPQQLTAAEQFVDAVPDQDIVIVTVANAQPLVQPTAWSPNRTANFDYQTFNALIGEIGGVANTPDGWATMSNDPFSVIGQTGLAAGQAQQNVATYEAGINGYRGGSAGQPGSLNGYLQMVTGNAYSYVSPEYLPIDTQASGSDPYTHNIVTLGNQTFSSATIANGDTGVQLVVMGAAMTPLVQATYTIIQAGGTAVNGSAGDPAQGNYGTGVQGLAATLQYVDRTSSHWGLVILQTFGQGPWWGNTPNGSPSWANDNVDAANLGSWNGSPFATNDGTNNSNDALYNVWNPGYPTVAGQIGSITSAAGHDQVAGFGGEDNQGVPNGGLTVVASTHPYDGRQNTVQTQTGTTQSPAQLVGTLTRTKQGQWTVQTASPTAAYQPSALWQTAFGPSQPWPYSTGADYQAAMSYIAAQLWGQGSGITDVRAQYVLKKSADWGTLAAVVAQMAYPGTSSGFTETEFTNLRNQLVTEMRYVAAVKNIVTQWQQIFSNASFNGYVDLQSLARTVYENSLANAQQHAQDTAGLNWLDISDYSLEVGASIIGFTPAAELAEPIGLVANVLGLASASMPDQSGDGGSRADSQAIWDQADLLGEDVVAHFNEMSDTLSHIEDVFVSDWGKLSQAGSNANGSWAFGTSVQTALQQSLAVTTKREFYEALLPLTYQEWVIDPNATGAEDDPQYGPSGRALPGRGYRCWGNGDPAYPNPPKTYPFANSPDGALSYAAIHGWNAPANSTPPAASNQSWYELRVLKSTDDPMQVVNDYWRGNNPTIWEPGADPPASLVNPLFEPINPADDSGNPTALGMDQTEFFGNFDDGWNWAKAVCS